MAETVAPYAEAHAGFRLEDQEAKLSGSLTGGPQRLRRMLRPLGRPRQGRARVGGP